MKVSIYKEQQTEMPTKKRICAYVRVSSEKDAQMESFENQEAYFKRKYENDDTCEFIGIFSDAGISGMKENRPAFQQMLDACRSGEVDLIHTKSISRFARNTVTVLQVSRELKQLGVGIYFEEQNINTLSSEGELMLSVLASFAQAEVLNMSENNHWAIQKKFSNGELMINTTRFFGYDKGDDGNLVINEEQAAIVRRIFHLYLIGNGAYRIAKQLNTEGITSLTRGQWHESTIRGMLKNEKYMGDAKLQKYYTPNIGGKTVLNKGEVQSYYVEDNHEAIISKEDWKKVQELTAERARVRNIDTKDTKKFANKHALTGKLKCPYCGKNLRRHHAFKDYVWACSTYIEKGKQACPGIRVPEKIANGWNITEPVVVKEMNVNGKKYYRHSGEEITDRRECSKEGTVQDSNGSILQSINRPRRTVIKL